MSNYITYSEYTTFGGRLDQTQFDRLVHRASAYIDYFTGNVLKDGRLIVDDVKMALTAIIDQLDGIETGESKVVSESVGRVSRSFAQSDKDNLSLLYESAFVYLSNAGLLGHGARIGHAYKL